MLWNCLNNQLANQDYCSITDKSLLLHCPKYCDNISQVGKLNMCKVFLGCHAPKIIKICQFSPSYSKNRAGFGGRIVNQQNMSIVYIYSSTCTRKLCRVMTEPLKIFDYKHKNKKRCKTIKDQTKSILTNTTKSYKNML